MPVFDAHKNFAHAAVASAPSPATSGTSLTVAFDHGGRFPATPFNATVWPTAEAPTYSNSEIVRVTNVTGDVMTIQRANEGTTAKSITTDCTIAATVTAKTIQDIESQVTKIIPFTILGNAAVTTYASRKYFPLDTYLKYVTISCGTAPSGGNLVLQLKKNGSNFVTPMSVTSGFYTNTYGFYDLITAGDYLQVSFTSVGSTPAANVTIDLEVF